jgi:hypothetical protein
MGSVGNSELPGDGASIATFGGRGQRRRRSRPRTVNGDQPQFSDEQGHCGTKGHHHQIMRHDLPEITCAIFFLMIRRPPRSTPNCTLFPYTTLTV